MAKFDKVIPPGQEGKIQLVIEGKKVTGNFDKSAQVFSNDPEHPVMTISMSGEITPYIAVEPAPRLYLQGRYDEAVEKKLTLRSNEQGLEFEVTKVESNIDNLITYKIERAQQWGAWELTVWKNPKLASQNQYGTITVHTNSQKVPEKVLQVQVITKSAITVQPQTLNFGTVQFAGTGKEVPPVTRNVIAIKSEGEFQIQDITFTSDRFSAEIEPITAGKHYTIKVSFLPPKKTQPMQTVNAEMIVHTNDPREPSLRVKLVARSV